MLKAKAAGVAIGANAELHAIAQTRFHELDFITGAVAAFVATRKNGDAFALGEKTFYEPDDHGGLAGATESEVTDTDDGSLQSLGAEDASFVEPGTEFHDGGVQDG